MKPTEEPVHDNRVIYDLYRTAVDLDLFRLNFPQYAVGTTVSWNDFTATTATPELWAPAPRSTFVPELAARHLTATPLTAPAACDTASHALFLTDADGAAKLYAYVYRACDPSGLLTPEGLVREYVYKYGMYDEKKYDWEMILYRNVKQRYRVGVAPWTGPNGEAGVAITVVDDKVFDDALYSWRLRLKNLYENMRANL